MRSHVVIHRATIKNLVNRFVLKRRIDEEGLPRDMAPALGADRPTPTAPFPILASQCFQ